MSTVMTAAMTDPVANEIALRDWVRRKLGTIDHELRVARVSEILFQLTRRWHDLTRADCRFLRLAALLHDVGRAHCDKGHAKAGAKMILESATLPLTDLERRRLAFMTLYHRGDVPHPGEERFLSQDKDNPTTMRTLLGLLRGADALDSRTLAGPQLVATVRKKTLTIYGFVAGDVQTASTILGRPKKFKLLESMLHCEIRTEWFATKSQALVS